MFFRNLTYKAKTSFGFAFKTFRGSAASGSKRPIEKPGADGSRSPAATCTALQMETQSSATIMVYGRPLTMPAVCSATC